MAVGLDMAARMAVVGVRPLSGQATQPVPATVFPAAVGTMGFALRIGSTAFGRRPRLMGTLRPTATPRLMGIRDRRSATESPRTPLLAIPSFRRPVLASVISLVWADLCSSASRRRQRNASRQVAAVMEGSRSADLLTDG